MKKLIITALVTVFVSHSGMLLLVNVDAQQGSGASGDEYTVYLPTMPFGHKVSNDVIFHRLYVPEKTGVWTVGKVSLNSYEAMMASPTRVFTETYHFGVGQASPSDASSNQYILSRGLLSFDLSDLPPGRIIDARLGLYAATDVYSTHFDFDIYIHEGTWRGVPMPDDFDSFVPEPLNTFHATNNPSPHGYFTVMLPSLVGRKRPDTMPILIRLPDAPVPPATSILAPITARVFNLSGSHQPVTYIEIAIEPLDS